MFKAEAAWLYQATKMLPVGELSPIANIGSSTGAFRTKAQPWTERELFEPLRSRGVHVIHVDRREEDDGIDIHADLMNDAGIEQVKALHPRAVFCCNLLEHVADPSALAQRCLSLVEAGGHIFVTVPYSYPYHRDPDDTMFRPTPEQLATLFPGTTMIRGEIVDVAESYLGQVKQRPWILLRHLFRLPFPFLGFTRWKRSMRKLYWLFNNYKVTCAYFRLSPSA